MVICSVNLWFDKGLIAVDTLAGHYVVALLVEELSIQRE